MRKDVFKFNGEVLKKRFFEPHCGRFFIYFDEIDRQEVVWGMYYHLMDGYVVDVVDDGMGEKMYVLFSVELDTDGISSIHTCKRVLKELLEECGLGYFDTISVKEYNMNKECQYAIDYVLEQACKDKNCVDGWSIAMLINNSGEFQFVEVLNACE